MREAFSNKIAAELERTSARDLYDLSQFEPLSAYDVAILGERLAKLSVNRAKPKAVTFQQASSMLRKRLDALVERALESELYPLIPLGQRMGAFADHQGGSRKDRCETRGRRAMKFICGPLIC